MSTVKLSLSSMSTVEKIQFTRRVAAAMELNNIYFQNPGHAAFFGRREAQSGAASL